MITKHLRRVLKDASVHHRGSAAVTSEFLLKDGLEDRSMSDRNDGNVNITADDADEWSMEESGTPRQSSQSLMPRNARMMGTVLAGTRMTPKGCLTAVWRRNASSKRSSTRNESSSSSENADVDDKERRESISVVLRGITPGDLAVAPITAYRHVQETHHVPSTIHFVRRGARLASSQKYGGGRKFYPLCPPRIVCPRCPWSALHPSRVADLKSEVLREAIVSRTGRGEDRDGTRSCCSFLEPLSVPAQPLGARESYFPFLYVRPAARGGSLSSSTATLSSSQSSSPLQKSRFLRSEPSFTSSFHKHRITAIPEEQRQQIDRATNVQCATTSPEQQRIFLALNHWAENKLPETTQEYILGATVTQELHAINSTTTASSNGDNIDINDSSYDEEGDSSSIPSNAETRDPWDVDLSVVVYMRRDADKLGDISPLCGPRQPTGTLSAEEIALVSGIQTAASLAVSIAVYIFFVAEERSGNSALFTSLSGAETAENHYTGESKNQNNNINTRRTLKTECVEGEEDMSDRNNENNVEDEYDSVSNTLRIVRRATLDRITFDRCDQLIPSIRRDVTPPASLWWLHHTESLHSRHADGTTRIKTTASQFVRSSSIAISAGTVLYNAPAHLAPLQLQLNASIPLLPTPVYSQLAGSAHALFRHPNAVSLVGSVGMSLLFEDVILNAAPPNIIVEFTASNDLLCLFTQWTASFMNQRLKGADTMANQREMDTSVGVAPPPRIIACVPNDSDADSTRRSLEALLAHNKNNNNNHHTEDKRREDLESAGRESHNKDEEKYANVDVVSSRHFIPSIQHKEERRCIVDGTQAVFVAWITTEMNNLSDLLSAIKHVRPNRVLLLEVSENGGVSTTDTSTTSATSSKERKKRMRDRKRMRIMKGIRDDDNSNIDEDNGVRFSDSCGFDALSRVLPEIIDAIMSSSSQVEHKADDNPPPQRFPKSPVIRAGVIDIDPLSAAACGYCLCVMD